MELADHRIVHCLYGKTDWNCMLVLKPKHFCIKNTFPNNWWPKPGTCQNLKLTLSKTEPKFIALCSYFSYRRE